MSSTVVHPRTAPRDVRAEFWSREFAHQNRRRCTWVSIGLALNVALIVTGLGYSTLTVVAAYVGWLLSVVALDRMRRRLTTRGTVLAVSTFGFALDLLFISVQMLNTGGGWWVGVGFYAVIVATASTGLPRAHGRVILALTLGAWTAVLAGQTFGLLRPAPWFGLPSVTDNHALLVTQYALGALALVAIWALLRVQVARSRRTLESYRRMVEASPYAIFIMGRDARIREANPTALRLIGFRPDQVIGRGLVRHVTPEHQALARAAFDRTLDGHVAHFEHGFRCGDGVVRWFSATYSPIDTESGEQAVLAIARDCTLERQAAAEHEHLQRELAESRRMQLVGRLVSGVAHELNNPLAAVMSFTEQLLAEARDDDARQALGIVHAQADRARAIVRDLLQVVRDRGERARTPTDLAALVTASAQTYLPASVEAGVQLRVDVADAGPRALVDAIGIGQVVDNILHNALLASPPGSTVSLTLAFEAEGWRITIADQGAGIPDAVRAHLFEPFFTTRPPGKGTGLGLAVSQGIVDQHGGSIEVENVPSGTGAVFSVVLPAFLAERADRDTRAATDRDARVATDIVFPVLPSLSDIPELEPMSHIPCLLLVDDEAAIRLALQRFMTRRGWTVEVCATGTEACERLMEAEAERRYDAVVCDLKMPGMTGIELYRHLERHRPVFLDRLILATGDVASQEVARFLDTVRCPVLEKPFALTRLAELLDALRPHATTAER